MIGTKNKNLLSQFQRDKEGKNKRTRARDKIAEIPKWITTSARRALSQGVGHVSIAHAVTFIRPAPRLLPHRRVIVRSFFCTLECIARTDLPDVCIAIGRYVSDSGSAALAYRSDKSVPRRGWSDCGDRSSHIRDDESTRMAGLIWKDHNATSTGLGKVVLWAYVTSHRACHKCYNWYSIT